MSTETQTHGRRRAPRYYLGGVGELADLESNRMEIALVRALSLYGCFVKTKMTIKEAGRVALKIAHFGNQFSVVGRVVSCVGTHSNRGLGIEFTEIDPMNKTRLEAYLSKLAANHNTPSA